MKQSDFLHSLRKLLNQYPRLDDWAINNALILIRHKRDQPSLLDKMPRYGKCLNCREVSIDYVVPLSHARKGRNWLSDLFHNWNGFHKVELPSQHGRHAGSARSVNGYSIAKIYGYLCDECKKRLEDLKSKEVAEIEEREIRRRRYKSEQQQRILAGKERSSPSTAFGILWRNTTNEDSEKLRLLPYDQFLLTRYWQIVRRYKLYRCGCRCELCSSKGVLHVHHKTYRNHGYEHLHLDDLITLCKTCHEKHHDKVVSHETQQELYRVVDSQASGGVVRAEDDVSEGSPVAGRDRQLQ